MSLLEKMYNFQSSSSNGTVCSSSNKKNGMSKRPLGVTCTSSNDGKGKGRGSAVRLSTDPQSVAARERRHRISDRFKTLQSLVPGGSKMDTVSMLEEAIQYVKFLKAQIWLHQNIIMINDALSNINDHNNVYHDRDHGRTVFLDPPDHHDIPLSNMGCFHEPSQVPPQPDLEFEYYSCFQNYETTSFDHVNINNSYVKY